MKLTWERIQSIIIVILVIVILLMSQCNNGGEVITEPKVITRTNTVWDTVEVEREVYVPKWRTKVVTEYVTVEVPIPQEVDTTEILKDYYSQYVYLDTIDLDSLGYITILDTVTENKIMNRYPDFQITIPTKIIERDIYINNREFYAGIGARTNGNHISWMGLEGVFKNRRGNTFVLGVGTDDENKLSIGGGVHWKIGKE